ncbi:MAG: hypothetical protein HQK96_06600 [Nitrospirae bacterium]|nr:hypothetical protein [Nitrospirota bacterium]
MVDPMLLCPCLGKNGKMKFYRGFQIYEYVSENKRPCHIVKYKAYLPRKGLVTRPYKKISQVKKEIDYIITNFMVCEPLRRALPRTKRSGKKRCGRGCTRMV